MKRALFALILTPVLASLLFGAFALVAVQIMLVVTVFIALPLLILLRRFHWLDWWHALLAGAFCGACFVAMETFFLAYAPDLDRLMNSNNVFYVGLGAATGFAFWWIGVFRNPAFPFVSRDLPRGAMLVVPLAAAGVWVHRALEEHPYQGRVVAVLKEPHSSSEKGQVSVRLSKSSMVQADFGSTWPVSMVQGRCFHLTERWSTFRARRIYELISPFGGGVDDC